MNRLRAVVHCVVGLLVGSPAYASFHLMKIEQVIGGVGGDASQQAIQLRMRAPGQELVGTNAARLVAWDATGANPVTLLVFPSDVANAAQGSRILVVSPAFAAAQSGIVGDFTMTNVIPASYLAAGRLTYEYAGGVLWSLAWGGAGYTGSNAGLTFNDADGNFGPPFGSPLPSTMQRALLFSAPDPTGSALSTNNLADYSITPGAAVFTNNGGASGTVAPLIADLSITKTDGRTTASPGQTVTYTIVASNAGPGAVTGATVMDTLPAALTGATWTCLGSGGGTCTPAGAGSINDPAVNLPVGASVIYTLTGTVSANPSRLLNTAMVFAPPGVPDPLNNNQATDDDVLLCFGETTIVPDGRVTSSTIAAGATAWFAAQLRIGSSYSVEFANSTDLGTLVPGTLTVYSGDDGCSGTSTLAVHDTTGIDPPAPASRRVSFTASGEETFFRAKLFNGSGTSLSFTFAWSETSLYGPAWSTNGTYDTYYSFQNTTGATVNGTLTLMDAAGTVLSTSPVSVPAGATGSANTSSLAVARSRTGTAKLAHDGPPGAIVAEAAIANFSFSPAYVQPVQFKAVRESR